MPPVLGKRAELVEQPRLADSGLSFERQVCRLATAEGVEDPLELDELALAPDEPRAAAVR